MYPRRHKPKYVDSSRKVIMGFSRYFKKIPVIKSTKPPSWTQVSPGPSGSPGFWPWSVLLRTVISSPEVQTHTGRWPCDGWTQRWERCIYRSRNTKDCRRTPAIRREQPHCLPGSCNEWATVRCHGSPSESGDIFRCLKFTLWKQWSESWRLPGNGWTGLDVPRPHKLPVQRSKWSLQYASNSCTSSCYPNISHLLGPVILCPFPEDLSW